MSAIVERLLKLLATNGVRQYGEERVSQCEHALQCALLAEQEDAPRSLVAAALLHDIGHLLYDASERPSPRGVDDRHEELGAKHLREAFGAAVAEPVRLHVAAKRYLCAIDPAYFGLLSAASVHSLELQGGAFTIAEADAFRSMPYADEATRIRRWDEAAKLPGYETRPLEYYRPALIAALRS